jgi:hypothetical protein
MIAAFGPEVDIAAQNPKRNVSVNTRIVSDDQLGFDR